MALERRKQRRLLIVGCGEPCYLPRMRRVSIVGGGMAGLTLGVLLARAGVPVEVWEAGRYPRHRVCGEFISGAGAGLLLGLVPELGERAFCTGTVRFFSDERSSAIMRLPSPGCSISRWDLDQALAAAFRAAGGDLRNGRWTESFEREGMVRATGRRTGNKGWIGLKAHVRDLELSADLEMHFTHAGYLGISRIPDGANFCALVRDTRVVTGFRENPLGSFGRLMDAQSPRLAAAVLEFRSVCAVSGIDFDAAPSPGECCVGDAIRMIPPFTGNGMSLAVESAFVAAPTLASYSRGAITWAEARDRVRRQCEKRFAMRFLSAAALAWVADRSWTRHLMLSTLKTVPGCLRICFALTR